MNYTTIQEYKLILIAVNILLGDDFLMLRIVLKLFLDSIKGIDFFIKFNKLSTLTNKISFSNAKNLLILLELYYSMEGVIRKDLNIPE